MKSYFLIGIVVFCMWWWAHAYEPSLYEAERLQTAEKLLRTVPTGMHKDIEQRLINHESKVEGERERFCIQYLLYQINMIAKQAETKATTNTHSPHWRIARIIDDHTFLVEINGKTYIKTFGAG